jgi:hypothetical protein
MLDVVIHELSDFSDETMLQGMKLRMYLSIRRSAGSKHVLHLLAVSGRHFDPMNRS